MGLYSVHKGHRLAAKFRSWRANAEIALARI